MEVELDDLPRAQLAVPIYYRVSRIYFVAIVCHTM